MVYESDFYTTRRPYRPSSYSVSPLTSAYYLSYPSYSSSLLPYLYYYNYNLPTIRYSPKLSQRLTSVYYHSYPYPSSLLPYLYYYNYSIPTIRYSPKLSQAELIYRPTARTVTRLTTYPEIPYHVVRVRVRPSVVLRELDRISNRYRPAITYSPLEDFYRSEASKQFEDETRRIRADTASLLQRARSVVPRAKSVMPYDTIYTYPEPLPYRFSNDAYINKLLWPIGCDTVRDAIKHISYWHEPAKRFTGRGHLACLHYSGNKGFSNRRPLYHNLSIRDDVNLLSFYAKNRLAAAGLATDKATGDELEQPSAA